jgi:glycerophosphoryl diester phosphodiesterase
MRTRMLRIAATALGLSLLPCAVSSGASQGRARSRLDARQGRVVVIAHRGANRVAPENTLAAYRAAIDLGVDFIEIDVQTTADGQLVLMHDSTVDRTTNGSGAVRSLTLSQIKELDAGSWFSAKFAGEKAPTLEEAAALCRGKVGLYIDLKDASVPALISALERYGIASRVVIYGGVRQLQEIKRLRRQIAIMPGPGNWLSVRGMARLLAGSLHAEVIDSHVSSWTPGRVREAHAAGARVWVDIMSAGGGWALGAGETDSIRGMREAMHMGVDGIQTDHPDVLLRLLGRSPPEKS